MKTFRTLSRIVIAAACAPAIGLPPTLAAPRATLALLDQKSPAVEMVVPVQADCHAIGQRVAAENGGQLLRASPSTQGGQAVCVIVVAVPGKDGQRPRRMEVVVPAN